MRAVFRSWGKEMKFNPLLMVDGYKFSHGPAYPKGTTALYDAFTPRTNKFFNSPFFPHSEGGSPLIWFGAQAFVLQWLVDEFQENFFNMPVDNVVNSFVKSINKYLGEGAVDEEAIRSLHALGYLPLIIKSIPEGSLVQMKVPTLTIRNTNERFAWLVGYLETLTSSELWPAATAATIAFNYKCIGKFWSELTCDNDDHLQWQFHDFSARGDMGMWASTLVGMGHMTSFTGTDGVFARERIIHQYNSGDDYLYGASVNATEHSVMCMGEKMTEIETFRRLINEIYPTGILSIVSDTWDYWKVITEYLPVLKEEILARDGKVVIRPDSGNPVDIICGRNYKDLNKCEHLGHVQSVLAGSRAGEVGLYKGEYYEFLHDSEEMVVVPEHVVAGSIEMMWRTFGGTINKKGFKVLNQNIGLIYGDSITLERAEEIFRRLATKSFASSNVVLGVGSYTYQYVTRDTFGFAMKALWGVVNNEPREIFKDPKTDDGTKKSHKGLLSHKLSDEGWSVSDCASIEEEADSDLIIIYINGITPETTTLHDVRVKVDNAVNIAVSKKLATLVKS